MGNYNSSRPIIGEQNMEEEHREEIPSPEKMEEQNELISINKVQERSLEQPSVDQLTDQLTDHYSYDGEVSKYVIPTKLNIILESQLNGEKRTVELTLNQDATTQTSSSSSSSPIKCGIDLKTQIETTYNIPICVQSLSFHNSIITNTSNLLKLRIQHGDTLHCKYTSQVDIKYFSELIKALTCISVLLETNILPKLLKGGPIDSDMHEMLEVIGFSFSGDSIPLRHFSVYPTGTPNANQLYFIHNGGLKRLLEIYRMIHLLPWYSLPVELQELEFSCLQIIWNFSATLGIRHLILQDGVVEDVFQSLMRSTVIAYSPVHIIEPLRDPYATLERSTYMLAETIYAAIVVIGNFAEVPQCRLSIASRTTAIENMIASMLSTTYTYTCARSGMCALLCLSFSPQTHQYLCKDSILVKILEICEKIHRVTDGTTESEQNTNQILVEFYVLIYLANLIHRWLDETNHTPFPTTLVEPIKNFMSRYMSTITYEIIQQKMDEKRYYWSTFIPFLNLCYTPWIRKERIDNNASLFDIDLHRLVVQAGLLSMKCMCVAENAQEVVTHEGLVDYVSCVSWFIPEEEKDLKQSAKELTEIAQRTLHLQPPSLTNIVKVFLAANYCGLESTLNRDAHSILLDIDVLLL